MEPCGSSPLPSTKAAEFKNNSALPKQKRAILIAEGGFEISDADERRGGESGRLANIKRAVTSDKWHVSRSPATDLHGRTPEELVCAASGPSSGLVPNAFCLLSTSYCLLRS